MRWIVRSTLPAAARLFVACLSAACWGLDAASAAQAVETAPPSPSPSAPIAAPLDGSTAAQVKARLGEPAVAHAEGVGAMWTYRLPRCALFVYFADAGAGLRVSGAETGPRRHGETPPDVVACLAVAPSPALAGTDRPPAPASTPAPAAEPKPEDTAVPIQVPE